ncbi:MAG: non-canonical purine NTP pyrophosphatase [Candidatus Moranbacteria bacterium]|jgi:inosine/xanthosine triphosphate pyrophosphatase family protein|nr:non-canonical purine NTP pyrophosphatase [Candidatus Moranbacteria bacterium]
MKILLATHNLGKIDRFTYLLKLVDDIEIVSLGDVNISTDVEEPFLTSRENAIHKAQEYARKSSLATLAIDDSATTNFLPTNEQPGVFLKRFSSNKDDLNERQIISVWKEIFNKNPQPEKQFIWDTSIALFNPNNNFTGCSKVTKISHVVDTSNVIVPGYPMGSFLSPEKGGKPYSEMTDAEKRKKDLEVFAEFLNELRGWLKN